jgi:type I restriction enzyme S subunit
MTTASRSESLVQPLGAVARFIRGITFKPEDKVSPGSEGSAVCMRTANVQTDLDQSDLIAIPVDLVKREEQFLKEGDILVSTANSWNLVGKCSWVPKLAYAATAGGFISILRADPRRVYRVIFFIGSPRAARSIT